MTEFKREDRYLVLKRKDIALLPKDDQELLFKLAEKVALWRVANVKPELDCVVVESDWPEFEIVFKMIEARATGAAGEPVRTLMDVTIDSDEALSMLRDMVVQEDGDLTAIRLLLGDGHAGYGLYIASADYPGEGAVLLADLIAPAIQPDRKPLTWQPIETAPQDGSEFLAWWDDGKGCKHRGVRPTHWLDNSHTRTPWAGWSGPSMAIQSAGLKPTHWMPLPQPPQKQTK